jgi:xylulose-5-phosphate/fructose-6-phosphate phosphoketolase
MVVLNQLDRFHLAIAALTRVPRLAGAVDGLVAKLRRKLEEHSSYVREHGEDLPEIQRWTWLYKTAAEAGD